MAVGKMLKVTLCANGFFSHRKPLRVEITQNIWYLIFFFGDKDKNRKNIYWQKDNFPWVYLLLPFDSINGTS